MAEYKPPYLMEQEPRAEYLVRTLFMDLGDRAGFQLIGDLDKETEAEMRETWKNFILEAFADVGARGPL